GVLQAMHKTKVTLAFALFLTLLAAGAFVLGQPAGQSEDRPQPADQAKDAEAGAGVEMAQFDLNPQILWPFDHRVWAVAFAPDGKPLASAGGECNRPSELVLWDPNTGKPRVRVREDGGVRSVAFSRDGRTLATADWDGLTARVRDAATGR